MHALEWLAPNWPSGVDATLAVVTLLLFATFKLDRARILYQRARFFDRLGASIIAFDVVVGLGFVAAGLIGLYPGINVTATVRGNPVNFTALLIDAAILTVMFWHWYEVRKANHRRIESAVGPSA